MSAIYIDPNGPAYMTSNENLRYVTGLTRGAKNILTIAASGDQALFYTLAGATNVDTFDVLDTARTTQDIKTTAISCLSYPEYISMLKKIRHNPAENIPEIVRQNLPPRSATDLKVLRFRTGVRNVSALPTPDEYARLQAAIHHPFSFIRKDLENIHKCVVGPYDVINISNIFDRGYMFEIDKQMATLKNLGPLLNVGGRIVYDNQMGRPYNGMVIQTPDMELRHQRESTTGTDIDLFIRTR